MTDKMSLDQVKKASEKVKKAEVELQSALEERKKTMLTAAKGNTHMEIALASGLSIQTVQRDLRDGRNRI